MSTVVSWNGQSYTVPSTGELNWGGTLKVDGLLISLAQNSLQKSGGLFTLSADVDFGGTAGLKALYFLTRTASPASTGVVRFANNEGFAWRNAANSGNLLLKVNASDQLEYNGSVLGGTIPATQGGTGQTTYATGDTLYASAANTLSKRTIGANQSLNYVATNVPNWLAPGAASTVLTLNGGVLTWAALADANLSATADITLSKVNGGTANRIIASNGTSSRLGVCGAITAGHVLYADANGLPVGEATLAVTRGGLNLSSVAAGELPYGSAANTYDKLPAGTSGQFLQSGGAAAPGWKTGYILGSVQTFTASGTWTRPAGCRAVMVELVGGGGGSGGSAATAAAEFTESGGGGGGGYSKKWITSPGSSEAVTVGAGGTAGASGNNAGGTGGTSSFGAHCSATGGGGGAGSPVNTSNSDGGVGGTGSGGDLNLTGSDGGNGRVASGARVIAAHGGASYFAGMRRETFATRTAGNAGYSYGGGASASNMTASQSAIGGAAGGPGIVIVYEYY